MCLWMLMLVWNFLPQPLQRNTLPLCCQIICWLCIGKDLKSLSQTLQRCMMMGLCASLRYDCLTSYWQKEPCSRICRGRRPVLSSTSRLSYISSSSLYLLLLIILLLLLISLLLFLIIISFSSLYFSFSSSYKEVWKASRLSLLACRDL